jgi:hypothetical protein
MPTWHSGQAWRVVNSLNKLNAQIRAYAPRAVPPATDPNSWGALADDAHSTSSDHYPHFYSSLGNTAVVCARDFPHAPKLGLDGGVVTEALRIARPAQVQYIIFDRRITGVNYGWQWRRYTGTDPHDTHFHISTVHDGRADSTAAWPLPGGTPHPVVEEPEMEQSDKLTEDTGHAGRTVGQALADLENLRNAFLGAGAAVPGSDSWPAAGSPLHNLANLPALVADAATHAVAQVNAEAVVKAITADTSFREAIAAAVADTLRTRLES